MLSVQVHISGRTVASLKEVHGIILRFKVKGFYATCSILSA